jgi:hypothetical protein
MVYASISQVAKEYSHLVKMVDDMRVIGSMENVMDLYTHHFLSLFLSISIFFHFV